MNAQALSFFQSRPDPKNKPEPPPEQVCFALFDGDHYDSTKHILPSVYRRMTPGAIGMIAVYYDEMLLPRKGLEGGYRSPRATCVVDEFFEDKPEQLGMLYANEWRVGHANGHAQTDGYEHIKEPAPLHPRELRDCTRSPNGAVGVLNRLRGQLSQ